MNRRMSQSPNPVDLVFQTGETVGLSNHTALVDKDGVKRLIADSAAPIKDGEGNTAGVVMVFRDVTQQRIMEEELLKAQKLESVGILAGGIAHDFNNLLTGVLGNIALAKMLTHPTEDVFQILDEAERASKRAAELTKQLLTFSKGGAPVKKMTQLDEMIVDTTRFALRGSRVKAVFRIAPDLYPMNADEGQISQVIHNMVLNASQAMPEGGVIEIVAKNVDAETSRNVSLPPEPHVAIAIRDQGPGIPNALQDKIFDPYFTTKENGSGLGLAAAYSIVRNHDGQIRLKSTEGHGSTFTVYLPATMVAATVSPVSSRHLSHGSGRILVMDDENMVRIVAQRILTQLGYEVICVSDGVEAIESYQRARARNEPFDLVIMDLTIPGGMGGKEAIVKLRMIDPAVQAVVASDYSNDPVLADYARFGFQGVVSKPYTISDLGETVHAVLSRKDDSS